MNVSTKSILDFAHLYAINTSGCTKVQVGAVIVADGGKVVMAGSNRAIPDLCKSDGCMRIHKFGNNSKDHRGPADCRAIHAEIEAICATSTKLTGSTMYVTRYPCEACARAICAAGIRTVVYGRKTPISKETEEIFSSCDVECIHYDWDAPDVGA